MTGVAHKELVVKIDVKRITTEKKLVSPSFHQPYSRHLPLTTVPPGGAYLPVLKKRGGDLAEMRREDGITDGGLQSIARSRS